MLIRRAVLRYAEGPDDVESQMSRGGRSAQARAEALRRRRRDRLRRSWPVVLLAVVTAFAFGFLLPRTIFAAMSSILTTLAPDSSGLPEWSFTPALSWTLGQRWLWPRLSVSFVHLDRNRRGGRVHPERDGSAGCWTRSQDVHVLHDVAMPGSRANIDHIAVTPSGVFTIETKSYTGKLEVRSRRSELWIARWNRSVLLDQARRQSEVMGETLARAGKPEVPVAPVLCFVEAELPLLFPPKQVNGVVICTRKSLSKRIIQKRLSTLRSDEVVRIAGILDDALGSAEGTGY